MTIDHDDMLIARYRDGEVAAFDELVGRYKSELFAYLCSMSNSREDAEDLFQETFVRVIAALPRYRSEGKFRRWLFRVARNLALDRARRMRVRNILVRLHSDNGHKDGHRTIHVECHDCSASPRTKAAMNETRDWIDCAVRKLPSRQREVFVLRQYTGMPFKEIAHVQRCPVSTVLARMRYALDKLRAELGNEKELYSEVP